MWAPADLFTPTINAIGLALQRAATFAWANLSYVVIAFAVLIALSVAVSQLRGRSRR